MASEGAVAVARISFGLRVGECLDEELEDMAWVLLRRSNDGQIVDLYEVVGLVSYDRKSFLCRSKKQI